MDSILWQLNNGTTRTRSAVHWMHSTLDTVQQHLDRIEERIQLISLLYCVKQLVTFVMPPWLPPDC